MLLLAVVGVLFLLSVVMAFVAVLVRHSVVGAVKDRLHDWLHRDRPECPKCAEWQAKADAQAMECQSLETVADDLASKLRACRVLAQSEKARADEAERQLMLGREEWITDPRQAEQVAHLTYARVIAMQGPKPPGVIPDRALERARENLCPPVAADGSWGRVNRPVPDLVLTKGETKMGCTVREADAAAQIKAALAFEEA